VGGWISRVKKMENRKKGSEMFGMGDVIANKVVY